MILRNQPLSDYEITCATELKATYISVDEKAIEEIKDLVRSIDCIYDPNKIMDYAALDRLLEGGIVNGVKFTDSGEVAFLFGIHFYLPDSEDYAKPLSSQNINQNKDVMSYSLGYIWLQYLGEVDEPNSPSLRHIGVTSTSGGARSEVAGVKTLLRKYEEFNDSFNYHFTHTVSGPSKASVSLWSSLTSVYSNNYKVLKEKGVKLYLVPGIAIPTPVTEVSKN